MANPLYDASPGAKYALYYITGGVLIMIWTGIWYYYLRQNPPTESHTQFYVCTGCFLSGMALLIIGLLVGRIGQEATKADAPASTGSPVVAPMTYPANNQPQAMVAAPVVQPAPGVPMSPAAGSPVRSQG